MRLAQVYHIVSGESSVRWINCEQRTHICGWKWTFNYHDSDWFSIWHGNPFVPLRWPLPVHLVCFASDHPTMVVSERISMVHRLFHPLLSHCFVSAIVATYLNASCPSRILSSTASQPNKGLSSLAGGFS